MVKKRKKVIKKEEEINLWKWATICMLIAFVVLLAIEDLNQRFLVEEEPKSFEEEISFEVKMCSSIRGTPAWTMSDGGDWKFFKEYFGDGDIYINQEEGFFLTYGRNSFGEMSWDVVNEELIPNQVHFFYSDTCGHCLAQIEYFGLTWEDYQAAGLTHNCREILK